MDKEKKGLHLKRATKLKIIFAGLLTTVAAMFATIYFADDQSHPKAVVVGAFFGLIFGGFLAALLMVLGTRDDKSVPKYDERQIAEQGKAYKYGFFTALIMLALAACSGLLQIEIPMEQSMLCIFVVVVMVAVVATPLIMKDAYFSLRENKRFLIIVVGLLGLLNLVIGVGAIASGKIMADGKITFMGGANLAAAALLIYIEIAIIIKSIIDKKED